MSATVAPPRHETGPPDAGDPPDDVRPVDDAERRHTVAWWLALTTALVFLVGAVGYVIGTHNQPAGPEALSDVDRGFIVDMTEHHDQAVEMALLEIAHGTDQTARDFAVEVVVSQRREIGMMKTLLELNGERVPDHDPNRTSMAWMGTPTPASRMPGLASTDDVAALAEARGAESDELFLTLMQAHHAGGIHMAEYARDHGQNAYLRELARRIAFNQQSEVAEYSQLLERMGVS